MNSLATATLTQNAAFEQWVTSVQSHIEVLLDKHLPAGSVAPRRLHQAMRYATLGGGKRVRALLCYAAAKFCNANSEKADIGAVAVELIHAFSLVHDDMPCMDDDDLRRGKPSTHKVYGDAIALLVGDALQSLAFQLISQDANLKDNQKINMLRTLAIASGSRGMAGGQAIDLESAGIKLTREALALMHTHKTGALISAGAALGAYSAYQLDEDKIKAVDCFSNAIGLAFQVVDDILDAEADSETLGKTAGKDALNNKSTYVTMLGLAAAKTLAYELHQSAITALAAYGREADLLRHLASFISHRDY